MLYGKKQVLDNLRNRDGNRVFYLGKGDILTNEARDYLTANRIPVLPADQAKNKSYETLSGETLSEKPEHMTHLNNQILVEKTHPRIQFRGALDSLQAILLLCCDHAPAQAPVLRQILALTRQIIACDVLEKPLEDTRLDGLDENGQRERSHFPQRYYGIAHFMPEPEDGPCILWLNLARCEARRAERAAVAAYCKDHRITRPDILKAMNRLSSMLYILMLREKAEKE